MRRIATAGLGLPAVVAALLLCVWSPGLGIDQWWPALALLAAAAAIGAITRTPAPLRPAAAIGLAASVSWAAWSTASVTWALDRGWAVEAAGRAWTISAALGLVLWWPARPQHGPRLAVVALATAGTLAAAVGWAQVLSGTSLEDGRLRGALPYANAFALLMIAAALAALGLALETRRLWLRATLSGLTVALLASGLAAQSRSSPAALGVGLLVFATLRRPDRAALLIGTGALLGVGLATPALLGFRRALLAGDDPATAARGALSVIVLGAVLAALIAAFAHPGDRPRAPIRVGLRRAGLTAAVLLALAPVVVAVNSRADYDRVEGSSTRFLAGGGSNRPDMWRVAWRSATARPLLGVGAGSFERPYLRLRRTEVAPRFAHSALAEPAATLGFPGLLLLAVLVGALMRIALGGRRGRTPAEAAAAAAAAAVVAHALVDWTLELPVIALAVVLAVGALHVAPERPAGAGKRRRTARAAAGVFGLAAAALVPAAVAAHVVTAAPERLPGEHERQLRTAADLAFLDPRPLESLAVVLLENGRPDAALRAARRAVARAPDDWFALWLAGHLEHETGAPGAGAQLLARARAANPREPAVLLRTVRVGGGPSGVLAAVRDVTGSVVPPR